MRTRLPRRSAAQLPSEGFSLLEVILALAILGGAVAVLGESLRLGVRCAEDARDLTLATMLCESKMDEILLEFTPLDSVQDVAFDEEVGDGSVRWLYSISYDTTEEEGVYTVCVTVAQDLPVEQKPISFSLVRWVPDLSLEPGSVTTSETDTGTTSEESGDLWAGFDMGGSSSE